MTTKNMKLINLFIIPAMDKYWMEANYVLFETSTMANLFFFCTSLSINHDSR